MSVESSFFTTPSYLIDDNLNNTSGTGGLLIAQGSLRITDNNNTYPAGTLVGWRINTSGFTVGSGGFVRIKTFLNGSQREVMEIPVVNLLSFSGNRDISMETTMDFDAIGFQYFEAAAGIPTSTVFYAFINRVCSGPQVDCNTSDLVSNTATALQRPEFPVYVNPERTGVNGVVPLSFLNNTDALVSSDNEDYASLVNFINLGSIIDVSVKNAIDTYPAGTWAGYSLKNEVLVGAEIFNIVQITTFNNGVEQETKTGEILLAGVPLFNFGDRNTLGFTTTQEFDEIRLRIIRPRTNLEMVF